LRFDRMSGLNAEQLDSLEECVDELLEEPWDKGKGLCRARTRTIALSWWFLCSLCRPAIFVDQAVDDVGALDPGGHIDRLAGLVQRRSLFPRLVWPMIVVMP
jgi:hypothetical protein